MNRSTSPVSGPSIVTTTSPNDAATGRHLLVVEDLSRSFGGLQAVDKASFGVLEHSSTGLIGPNGAGKSTVMNLIGGQLKPSAGRVLLEGVDIAGKKPHQISTRGVIRTFQTPNLFGRLTVLENLLVGAPPWSGESLRSALLGDWCWRRQQDALVLKAREVMERFGASEWQNETSGNLSGGQKRIVEIMRALMAEPKILLLDEPMAGINPTLAHRIVDHLLELRSVGITMLIVEHEMSFVERLCDPVIVMAEGRVLAEGSMEELRTNPEVIEAYLAG